jgi:hypothetical protein
MKIVELLNHIQLPLNNEESQLLERFVGDTPVPKSHLSAREQHLAQQLTVKDVLRRSLEDGKIYYTKLCR